MAESTEINVVINADVNGLVSGMNEVKSASEKVIAAGNDIKDSMSNALKPSSNADLLKKNYTDISKEIQELNEKLRNEIALKKQTAQSTAKRIQDLTKEQKAIEKQAQAMTKSRSVIGSMTSALSKLGIAVGVAFAVRAVINFAKESSKAYMNSQAAERKLLAALNNRVDIQQRLLEQAKNLQRTTIYSDEEVIAAQSFLAVQGRTEEQIKKTIDAAVNLSAVTGKDLMQSTRELDGSYEGFVRTLGRLDSGVKNLTKEQLAAGGAVEILGQKYAGMAQAVALTDEGKLKVLANRWDDLKEVIGEKFSSAVSASADVLGSFVDGAKELLQTDLSTKLDEEQIRVNTLAMSLSNANISASERNKIYEELKIIAPDVIKNIDIENVSTKILSANLAEYNKQMINKIVVTRAYEDYQKKANQAASDQQDIIAYTQTIEKAGILIREEANKVGGDAADAVNQQTKNYQNGAIGIAEYGVSLLHVIPLIDKLGNSGINLKDAYVTIDAAIKAVNNSQNNFTGSSQDASDALQDYNYWANKLGVSFADVSTGQDAYNKKLEEEKARLEASKKAQDDANKAKQDAKTQYQQLVDEIGKLQEKLQEQILSGKGDIEATKQQIIQKTALKNRVDSLTGAFEEQLKLLGDINRIEPLPFDPQTDAENYYNEFAKTLALLATSGTAKPIELNFAIPDELLQDTTLTDKLNKSGEEAGQSWIDGLIRGITGAADDEIGQIKSALSDALSFAENLLIDNLKNGNEELTKQLNERVDLISKSVDSVQEELDREIELNKQGFASNIELKRNELEQLKQEQDKAIAARDAQIEKQRKQERTAATISATIGAIKLLSSAVDTGGIAGLILGLVAVGSFLAAIGSINSQAESAIKFADGTAQILGGSPHTAGGTSLGEFGEAERGEFLGILSKKSTSKYGRGMMNLFDGLNKSHEDKIAMGLSDIAMNSGLADDSDINHTVTLNEIPEIKRIEKYLRQQPKQVSYSNGKRIEKNGNNTRIVYVN